MLTIERYLTSGVDEEGDKCSELNLNSQAKVCYLLAATGTGWLQIFISPCQSESGTI